MLIVDKLLPQGRGLAVALLKRAAVVSLDWDVRQKSRFEAIDSTGRALAVFLPRGTAARGGDVLVAQDGSLVRVEAAAQPVMRITPCAEHGSPFDLLRAAYHLGNRHVAIELQPDRLQIEPDPVLADLMRQMHLIVTEQQAAFEPEGGAYSSHGAAHGGATELGVHAHDHGHTHAAPAAISATAVSVPLPSPRQATVSAAKPHVHGPGCGHDHH